MKKLIWFFVFLITISSQINAQWLLYNFDSTYTFGGVHFVNQNVGWIFGLNEVPPNPTQIFKTIDTGNNWVSQFTSISPILSSFFLDENHGWFDKLESTGARLFYTTNGGTDWLQILGGFNFFHDLFFFDSLNGIAVGSFGAPQSGAIFKTTDGGFNWQIFYSNIIFLSCDFLDSITGWCGGFTDPNSNSILKTTDGGITWIEFPSNTLNYIRKIKFLNSMVGWVDSDGKLYNTVNGGITWNLKVNSINDFCFTDTNNGWYVAEDKIYHTTNGGDDWLLQHTNQGHILYNLFFLNSNEGWASGENGTLLRTINGGLPVELTSFTSSVNNNNVILSWQTATETNNSGFEIQRLKDSKIEKLQNWEEIGFVNGNGTTTEPQSYSFVDENLKTGKYQYRLKQIDFDGTFEYSNTVEVEINVPLKFSLEQNYPNPFNPVTSIQYAISSMQFVTLKVYDVLGKEVATLVNEEKSAGTYEVQFTVAQESFPAISSGVYFYQLKAGDYIETKKLIVMK